MILSWKQRSRSVSMFISALLRNKAKIEGEIALPCGIPFPRLEFRQVAYWRPVLPPRTLWRQNIK
eukprot:1619165-Heterocapsa_arctica.AAC.1